MGNCWNRCFGIKVDRRKYLRTRYSVERDFSIEFENLMDDDIQDDMQKPLTDREKELLTSKKYDAIVHEQKRIDTEIETQLARQEEELRLEEEAYYEAKREAARLSRLQRAKEQASRSKITAGSTQPAIQDAEWDITEGEDDFEMFLESVKARSITARAIQRRGSGDGQSSSSSTTHTKDRSHTEASSIDLEWEHEAGMVPQQRGLTDDTLSSLVSKTHSQSPNTSNDLDNDLEWDNDFVSSDTIETEQLITKPDKIQRQGNKLLLSKR